MASPDRTHAFLVPQFPVSTVGDVVSVPSDGDVSVAVRAELVYTGGAASCSVYLQTSLGGGDTWVDVCAFDFTTASAVRVSAVSRTREAPSAFGPSDGALPEGIVDGVLGDRLRAKVVVAGTYDPGTTVRLAGVIS